ncbi:MAG TPA: flagellar hook-associated protein FlgK [Acidimicrobiales bacterium]|nr:flagellar hook-associated protein FlgK [Acidimicrobiales bacterium]
MGDLALNIAASGLNAQQTAMDTISENLTNANTPGYISEAAQLTANPGGDLLGVGDGVRVVGVTQNTDGLLITNAQQSRAVLSQSTSLQQVLQGAESVFPEPGSSGISADLASFWQAWDGISQDPSNPAPRTQVVDLAQNLASDFQQAAEQLGNLQSNAQAQVSSQVAQANTMLRQVASLNTQIAAVNGSGSPANALIDQRNQLMNQLASSIGAVGIPEPDGTINVGVNGVTLVQGSWSDTIKATGGVGSMSLVAQASGVTIASTGGEVAGQLAAINQYLPAYQAQLDATANNLSSTVNGQLAAGFTATGASGSGYPLFQGSGAAGLTVNAAVVSNTQLIAASSTATLPDATNNGGNAQAMAELFNAPTGPDLQYQSLIQGLGSQVQAVNNQVQAQTSVANAAQQNLQAIIGVNTNDQMVQMLTFQQAFQASAKLISTVDTMMQALIQAS